MALLDRLQVQDVEEFLYDWLTLSGRVYHLVYAI